MEKKKDRDFVHWNYFSNFYPHAAYEPAYRSGYFYSPWLHNPLGSKPYNPYKSASRFLNYNLPWTPQNTYKWPYTLPPLPLVTAQSAQTWGYPGFYQNYPNLFPGGGSPGFEHPNYPFHIPGFWPRLPPGQKIRMPSQNLVNPGVGIPFYNNYGALYGSLGMNVV